MIQAKKYYFYVACSSLLSLEGCSGAAVSVVADQLSRRTQTVMVPYGWSWLSTRSECTTPNVSARVYRLVHLYRLRATVAMAVNT